MSKTEEFYKKAQEIVKSYSWLKVIFVGDAGTGKTSLIKNFYDVSITDEYFPTIGVDYGYKVYTSKDHTINKDIRVNIWDFSGDADYMETRRELYINTDIIVLVYDLTNLTTFENIQRWISEFLRYGNQRLDDVQVLILGNKCDLEIERQVDFKLGEKVAKHWNALHFITSAKTGLNVRKALEDNIELRVAQKLLNSSN